MTEPTEAEWMAKIAEAMGLAPHTVSSGTYDFCAGEQTIKLHQRVYVFDVDEGTREFSILKNPADCLAAIKYFRLDVCWPRTGFKAVMIYASIDEEEHASQVGGHLTLEAAIFAACKKLVEE